MGLGDKESCWRGEEARKRLMNISKSYMPRYLITVESKIRSLYSNYSLVLCHAALAAAARCI